MESKRLHTAIIVWTNFCRFLLAAVFIFSGFIKSNDPFGTVYKLQDYLEAWGLMSFFPEMALFLCAMFLGVFEFALGIYLLFGIRRKLTPFLVLLTMLVLTPLTLWLALTNPIDDCGCFGDAIILTNWETFWKNVILLLAAVSVFKWSKYIFKLVTDKVDWLVALYSIVFILFYGLFCIKSLPVFDILPYHVGADIREGMEIPDGEKPAVYDTRFIYAKDGVEKEFTIDNIPEDSAWIFVDSKTVVKEEGYEPPIHDFYISSQLDGEDLTDEVLDGEKYTFLLVSPSLAKADDSGMDLINEVYDYTLEHGYRFLCVTASSGEDIAAWQESTGAEYPFALMDEITLKTMIRSNPGLMLLKNGVVINKWSVMNFPDEYQLTAPLEELDLGMLNEKTGLHRVLEVIGWFVCPLLCLVFCDLAWLHYRGWHDRRKKNSTNVMNE